MGGLFKNCESLISIDLSSFNTSSLTDTRNMFDSCQTLISIDLSSFNTENVKVILYMFFNTKNFS